MRDIECANCGNANQNRFVAEIESWGNHPAAFHIAEHARLLGWKCLECGALAKYHLDQAIVRRAEG